MSILLKLLIKFDITGLEFFYTINFIISYTNKPLNLELGCWLEKKSQIR